MKKQLAILLLGAVLAAGAQARSAPIYEPARVRLTSAQGVPLGAEQVRAAIVSGAAVRHWQVVAQGPDKVTLRYEKAGKFEAVVDVNYSADGFQVVYVSSNNLEYQRSSTGTEIHPNYNRWIKNLELDIGGAARASR